VTPQIHVGDPPCGSQAFVLDDSRHCFIGNKYDTGLEQLQNAFPLHFRKQSKDDWFHSATCVPLKVLWDFISLDELTFGSKFAMARESSSERTLATDLAISRALRPGNPGAKES